MTDKKYAKEIEGQKAFRVKLAELRPYDDQPRTFIPPENVTKMAASFRHRGQITSIQVRELIDDLEYGYELIEGETRYLAALELGWDSLDATLEIVTDPEDHFERSFVANFLRNEAIPVDKARGMARMKKNGRSAEEIRDIIG